MIYDARYGPEAQTPQQREYVLKQMLAALPRLRAKAATYGRQLCARYVAGELTWPDVCRDLAAAQGRA